MSILPRDNRISIRFFDHDGEYAARYWFNVPRAGDEIMLGAGKRYTADPYGKAAFKVLRVVWGVEGSNDLAECVNIELEPAASTHPDDIAVDRFAAAMKAKLAKKRDEGRGGWNNPDECSGAYLSFLLVDHVEKGDPLDVGNLAMMLHQRGERIADERERYAARLAQKSVPNG